MSSFANDEKAPPPAAPAAAPAKPDLNQGSAKFTAVCAACHGADGNSGVPANPKLAQQHPEYLVKQLQEFKNGKRSSPVMQAFAAQLSDADMKNVAYWAGSQKAKPGFAKDKDWSHWASASTAAASPTAKWPPVPAATAPTAPVFPSQYPRLSGQHADYTYAQLAGFRDGARKNSLPMTQVAARLSDTEIRAVADYIAGLR